MYRKLVSLLQPSMLYLRLCGVWPPARSPSYIHVINKTVSLVFVLIIVQGTYFWYKTYSKFDDIFLTIVILLGHLSLIRSLVMILSANLSRKTISRFLMIMESTQQTFFNLNINQPPRPTACSQLCWLAVLFLPGTVIAIYLALITNPYVAIHAAVVDMVTTGTICKMRVLQEVVSEKLSLLNWHFDGLNHRSPLFLPRPLDANVNEMHSVDRGRRTRVVSPSQGTRTLTATEVRDINKAHLKLAYAYRTFNSNFSWISLTIVLSTGIGCLVPLVTFLLFQSTLPFSLVMMISLVLRSTMGPCVLLTMATQIEEKSRQTALLVHDLLDEDGHSPEVVEELERFSLALLHRKMKLTAAGYFDMNLKLIPKMAAVLAPATLFLVQRNNRSRQQYILHELSTDINV